MSANFFWAYRELTNRLEKRGAEPSHHFPVGEDGKIQEWGTIFLFDPEVREKLDKEIRLRYFPAVLKGLRGSRIRVHNEANILSQITDGRDPVAARELIFLLEEPPYPPSGPNSPPWYVRGTIDCSLLRCMVHFDLMLDLPLSVDLEAMLELMDDDKLGGIPPSLSFERVMSGEHLYLLSFSSGNGISSDIESLTDSVRKHLLIIDAVKRLERQWSSRKLFSDLGAKIIAMYGDNTF